MPRRFPLRIRRSWPKSSRRFLKSSHAAPCFSRGSRGSRPIILAEPKPINDFLVALNNACSEIIEYIVRPEPGIQTCEETLTIAAGLVPGQRLVTGADSAQSWPRRAVRFRVSDSTCPRCKAARRSRRPEAGFHRPARLGRGLHPRGRLDRAGPDIRPLGRRRAHPAGVHGFSHQRRPGHWLHRCLRV